MKSASLATTYRPQTFAEVAGQELIVKVLSNSVAQDKIAPAYLLSGTRGVGKTTIARILAKALNCIHAPNAEPCNQCEQCKKITQGIHVDVHEIDGASNNGVDDARALREHIGYAPMEGRYKVFIIDEAHMLTRPAFNAMLKTLEEPPPRVVFIFASTEAHKFPITIVSRCQHFVLKRLTEAQIVKHLTNIIQQEEVNFEPEAIKLIAKRACGSVRDGMSLLGQSLALGSDILNAKAVRSILGMASLDIYNRLLDAIVEQDCLEITDILREILDEGIDIGFFLREFTTLWRTLFLLRQDGDKIIASLDLSEDEASLWLNHARRLSLTHIHAAWHMVLESQRRITQSQEPSSALELLLLNISLMPRLLPLEKITNSDEFYPQDTHRNSNKEHVKKSEQTISSNRDNNNNNNNNLKHIDINDLGNTNINDLDNTNAYTTENNDNNNLKHIDINDLGNTNINDLDNTNAYVAENRENNNNNNNNLKHIDINDLGNTNINDLDNTNAYTTENNDNNLKHIDINDLGNTNINDLDNTNAYTTENRDNNSNNNLKHIDINDLGNININDLDKANADVTENRDNNEQFITNNILSEENYIQRPFNWEDLYKFICEQKNVHIQQTALKQAQATFADNTLFLETQSTTVYNAICKMEEIIQKLATSFFQNPIKIIVQPPQNLPKTQKELITEAETYLEIKNLKKIFDARIEDCQPIKASKQNNN